MKYAQWENQKKKDLFHYAINPCTFDGTVKNSNYLYTVVHSAELPSKIWGVTKWLKKENTTYFSHKIMFISTKGLQVRIHLF